MIRKVMLAVLLVALALISNSPAATAQDLSTEFGTAAPGQTAYEVLGQIDQVGFTMTTYGYVTGANGIVTDLLFVEGTSPLNRDEASARLTFTGTGSSLSRSVHENIFSNDVNGTLTFYWNEIPSGISWDDPSSFGKGVPIATITMRLHSILNVQAPDVGVLLASSDGTQDSATPFTINGQSYQFGHTGLVLHVTDFGQGFRSSAEPLAAHYLFGGEAVVVGGVPN